MAKFTANNLQNEEVELEFVEATSQILGEATKIYNKTFAEQLEAGGLLRKKLSLKLREQGLWSDEQQKALDDIQKIIVEKEHALHTGGIKLSEAKELAISLRVARNTQAGLLSSFNEYDNITVEGQADNARFNYLVYSSTVYSKDKKRYFDTYEDFVSYKDPVAFIAASKYAKEYYNLDDDFESSLPENKFLKKFKFVNDDLQLIDSGGKLVDLDGNLVNEDGNKIDKAGNIIDILGYKRTKDGTFADKPKPFLSDNGKPVAVDSEAEKELVSSVEDSA